MCLQGLRDTSRTCEGLANPVITSLAHVLAGAVTLDATPASNARDLALQAKIGSHESESEQSHCSQNT